MPKRAEREPPLRVLVALDALASSRSLLETALDLAARWGAELIGLYVEDIELLNVASLPFCREFGAAEIEGRVLDPTAMARSMRLQAQRMREAVESAARQTRVPCTFRVTRGRVDAELLAASREADVVVVGRARSVRSQSARLGSVTHTVVSEGACTVVVSHEGTAVGRPVLVVYDGSAVSQRALTTAVRLVEADHQNLVVLLAANDSDHARELERKAAAVLRRLGIEARMVRLLQPAVGDLVRAMREERCRTLVLAADLPLLQTRAAASAIEGFPCPVVLVR